MPPPVLRSSLHSRLGSGLPNYNTSICPGLPSGKTGDCSNCITIQIVNNTMFDYHVTQINTDTSDCTFNSESVILQHQSSNSMGVFPNRQYLLSPTLSVQAQSEAQFQSQSQLPQGWSGTAYQSWSSTTSGSDYGYRYTPPWLSPLATVEGQLQLNTNGGGMQSVTKLSPLLPPLEDVVIDPGSTSSHVIINAAAMTAKN